MTTDLTPTIDVELLRKTLEHVTVHRDEWAQTTWLRRTACGTFACLGGHAVLLSGRELHAVGDTAYVVASEDDLAAGAFAFYLNVWDVDGRSTGHRSVVSVSDATRVVLGLTHAQAASLFAADNTLAALWTLAARFTDGAIEPPPAVLAEHGVRVVNHR